MRDCCSCANVTKWAFGSVGIGSTLLIGGYAIYNYTQGNIPGSIISTIVAAADAALTGSVFKYFPTRQLQDVVTQLSTLPSAFSTMLQGANGQVVSLDDALKNLQAYGDQNEKFISDLKVLLTQLQQSLNSLKTTDQHLVELNDQYKKNIGIFLQLIASVDHENSALKVTASKVSSQVALLTKEDSQLTTDFDVEKGLSAQLEVEKQTLASLGTDLSAFVTEFNQSLVEKGKQLIQLQQELDQEKQTNQSLKSEIEELQTALPKIEEERRQLALDQQKLEQARAALEAKLDGAHAA